jgi:hypothetical protein
MQAVGFRSLGLYFEGTLRCQPSVSDRWICILRGRDDASRRFQINLEAYKQVPVSARYDYIRDKVRGARKFQNLLMTGLDNPPHPEAPSAE